jgi:asparagine synthase (glutamine-hydrolysing)
LPEELVAAYLALGYVPAPQTFYPSVRRLPAASNLVVRNGRAGEPRRYWSPPIGSPGRGSARPLDEPAINRLRDALLDSLKGRLIADVPMCCFLSSGIDSSLVAALAKRDLGTDLECVTVAFPGAPVDDEAPMAAETARHLGLAHRRVVSNANPEESRAEDVLELYGQPCDATTALSIRQMTQVVAADFKAGLTGSGGDEITFGYGKHAHFNRHRRLYGLPEKVRLMLGAAARATRPLTPRLDRIAFDIGTRDWERYIAQKNFPAIDWLRLLPGFPAWCQGRFDDGNRSLELAVPEYEIADVMPNSRLISMDLGSMRSSVELRTPFLSRRVLETVAGFDPRALIAFGQKSVLRRLLARYLPRELVEQPKRGFVFPIHYLIAPYGERPPVVPGVAVSAAEDVWRRLPEGKGWPRIAMRLALMHEFLVDSAAPENGPGIGAGGR